MLRGLVLLAFVWAGQAHAYTYVFQCDLRMGGAIITDNTPQRVRFEVTYEWGQPSGWMVGAPGEVEITLVEDREVIRIVSLLQTPERGAAHAVIIQQSGDAVYLFNVLRNGVPVTYQWQGICENMRPM